MQFFGCDLGPVQSQPKLGTVRSCFVRLQSLLMVLNSLNFQTTASRCSPQNSTCMAVPKLIFIHRGGSILIVLRNHFCDIIHTCEVNIYCFTHIFSAL